MLDTNLLVNKSLAILVQNGEWGSLLEPAMWGHNNKFGGFCSHISARESRRLVQ